MPSKIQISLQSPVFWSMVGIFLLAGISAIIPQLQGSTELIAMAVVAGLGALIHPGEVQKAGNLQKSAQQ